MKKYFVIFLISFLSCHYTKSISADPMKESHEEVQLQDSALLNLRQKNDVVIAFALIQTAWVKSVNYKIVTLNKNEWKGYNYSINNTRHTTSGLTPVNVSNDSCNALWKFIQERDAVKIKDDNGENFCSGDKKNSCNINDGASWQLLFITKKDVVTPAFYEPEFYENCCPGNTDRQLFLQVANRIKNTVNSGNER